MTGQSRVRPELGRPAEAADPRALLGDAAGLAAVATLMVVAGGLVAAVNSASPFDHGSWLAAYLVLVGGVAQLVLGVAPRLLGSARSDGALRRAQLVVWNVGVGAVAAGVFLDSTAVVLAGSAVVLAALVLFARGVGTGRLREHGGVLLYQAFVAFLAVSVLVGMVLAGGSPGS